MNREPYDDFDDIDDDELDRMRRRLEYKALRVAHDMLDDPATSPTAKASIIRGSLSDSAARRNDDDSDASPFDGMSREEIRHAILVTERKLAMLEKDTIADAEVEEVAPVDRGVFD